MYQTDYEPTDTGAVLTTGAIGKLAAAAAENRSTLAKLASKLDAALDDLSARIASVEAEAKARIKAAEIAEATKQHLARRP